MLEVGYLLIKEELEDNLYNLNINEVVVIIE